MELNKYNYTKFVQIYLFNSILHLRLYYKWRDTNGMEQIKLYKWRDTNRTVQMEKYKWNCGICKQLANRSHTLQNAVSVTIVRALQSSQHQQQSCGRFMILSLQNLLPFTVKSFNQLTRFSISGTISQYSTPNIPSVTQCVCNRDLLNNNQQCGCVLEPKRGGTCSEILILDELCTEPLLASVLFVLFVCFFVCLLASTLKY